MQKEFLQINNISKIYTTKQTTHKALDAISLNIYEGEILALLGVNGAGKTTLSGIVATLHPATSGTITYSDGKRIEQNLMHYRSILGYCPQKPNLDFALTVEQNLLFAGRFYLMPEPPIRERLEYLYKILDLKFYAHAQIKTLSGGYQQRVLIARTLIHKPKMIIFDEPTIALDPHVRRQIWQVIKNLKSEGATILLTTHYLDEAEYLADRVCILDRGVVRLIDTPDNLKKIYAKHSLEDVFLQLLKEDSAQCLLDQENQSVISQLYAIKDAFQCILIEKLLL